VSKKLFDFERGPVKAHRHINPDKTLGGWVADTAEVDHAAFVGVNAQVYDCARVYDVAHIGGRTRIHGNATICGRARISGAANISDRAWVAGDSIIGGSSVISGKARIGGSARVRGMAVIAGEARVTGEARIDGRVEVRDACISGATRITGNVAIGLPITIQDNTRIRGGCDILLGSAGGYYWYAVKRIDGVIVFRFGCESHELRKWTPRLCSNLAERYEPTNPQEFTRITRALTLMIRSTLGKRT